MKEWYFMPGNEAARIQRLAALLRQERESVRRVVAEAKQASELTAQPSGLVVRGVGDVIHDFYTGVERMMERIAAEFDGGPPAGAAWHRDLLTSMSVELSGIRPAVFRTETVRASGEFLRFRHLFRNTYGFELEWPRLKTLLNAVPPTWALIEADLTSFLTFLDGLSARLA
jgi:hypothetical protein